MELEWSDRAICHHVAINGGTYRDLKILAELNLCSISRIEQVLRNNGFVKKKVGRIKIPNLYHIPQNLINTREENTKVERKSILDGQDIIVKIHDTSVPPGGYPDIKIIRKI